MNAVTLSADIPVDGDDRALVAQARTGEVGAFEALYRRHHARIFAVCLRLARDRELAEDSLQDAFILAWEKLAEFRGDAAFGSWLYRIAINASLARMRSQVRRERHLGSVGDPDWERIGASDPEPGLTMDLEAAVATLPEGARTVLVLHDIEGYGHGEIANMTGIAVGTSKAQLHRARRLLRQRLER